MSTPEESSAVRPNHLKRRVATLGTYALVLGAIYFIGNEATDIDSGSQPPTDVAGPILYFKFVTYDEFTDPRTGEHGRLYTAQEAR
jgi:hypothetical protein